MVKNESGDFEMHLQHIQSKSIQEAHKSFLQSDVYHDWRYENRWVRNIANNGFIECEEVVVQPSIGLRLFSYAICHCSKDPTQRDCADSMIVGFTHLLSGLGKIRMSDFDNKKRTIAACNCEFHKRQINKDLWKSPSDFMTAMLCAPKVYDEFEKPELSKYTTKVLI